MLWASPRAAASHRGVRPTASRALKEAPPRSRTAATSGLSFIAAARCRAVRPAESIRLRSEPAFKRASATGALGLLLLLGLIHRLIRHAIPAFCPIQVSAKRTYPQKERYRQRHDCIKKLYQERSAFGGKIFAPSLLNTIHYPTMSPPPIPRQFLAKSAGKRGSKQGHTFSSAGICGAGKSGKALFDGLALL